MLSFRPIHAPAAAPPAPQESKTTVELEAALQVLNAERSGHREALELLPERERELLDRDAPDRDLEALAMQRRRILHQLDRLDEREGKLLDLIEHTEHAERRAQWAGLVDQYERAASEIVRLGAELQARQQELNGLAGQADGLARGWQIGAALPWFTLDLSPQALAYPMNAVRAARGVPVAAPRHARLWGVRFLRSHELGGRGPVGGSGYAVGAEAGFTAAIAWSLVEAGVAEWQDLTRVPPDPRPKRPKPVNSKEEHR